MHSVVVEVFKSLDARDQKSQGKGNPSQGVNAPLPPLIQPGLVYNHTMKY